MDLFRVNHYMAGENKVTDGDETLKLERLKQQIQKRLKMRQMNENKSIAYNSDGEAKLVKQELPTGSDYESKKWKKNRKRSRVDELDLKESEKIKRNRKERKEKVKTQRQIAEYPKSYLPTCSQSLKEINLDSVDYDKSDDDKGIVDDDNDESYGDGKNDFNHERGLATESNNANLNKQCNREEQKVSGNSKSEEFGFTVIGNKVKEKQLQKVQRVLPEWLAKPTIIDPDLKHNLMPVEELKCLDKKLIDKLKANNIEMLFPVQSHVIPAILSALDNSSVYGCNGYQPPDMCVSAPTGSGKTLAYTLPIIQTLMRRCVRRLQALVIVPTKDLAGQVKQVFCTFTEGTGLNVGLASGEYSFAKEQKKLVDTSQGGTASRVDILVATPGRLVDHITSTPGFSLSHLRFIIIDEADRLLDQAFHGWLKKVLKAAYKQTEDQHEFTIGANNRFPTCRLKSIRQLPYPISPCSLSRVHLPLQKLLFSATLTHNPEKLAPLQLYQPVFYLAHGKPDVSVAQSVDIGSALDDGKELISNHYNVPSGLTEYMAVCKDGEKPLVVLYLVKELKLQQILCFTSSVESTHRLFLLIKLFGGVEVAEYSSSLTPQRRRAILRHFRKGKIQLLVCSDAMARGMDIENVMYVISYDAPNFAKTYIHRVGRTARAGNTGTAFTLLHSEEVYHFQQIIHKTGRKKIKRYNLKENNLSPLVENYQVCLDCLKETLNQEKLNVTQSKGRSAALRLIQQQMTENLNT